MRLGLVVTQFVNRLQLRRNASAGASELTAYVGIAPVRVVLQRRDTLDKQLERIDIARIADTELPVVLRKGVDYRVELAIFLALVLPVGVHRQTKRIFPFIPIVNLDAFIGVIGKHFVHRLVSGVPMQASRHRGIAIFEA